MFIWRNVANYPKIISVTPSYLVHCPPSHHHRQTLGTPLLYPLSPILFEWAFPVQEWYQLMIAGHSEARFGQISSVSKTTGSWHDP